MALNIKNTETEKLARDLARLRGEGITEALTAVLRREVARERRKPRRDDIEERLRRIDDIVRRFNEHPVLDDRSPDEIIGYNEHGHFD